MYGKREADIKRKRNGRRQQKRETLTQEQNEPTFNSQLRAFDEVFSNPSLSLSLVKIAITCPGQSHIKQTLALSRARLSQITLFPDACDKNTLNRPSHIHNYCRKGRALEMEEKHLSQCVRSGQLAR